MTKKKTPDNVRILKMVYLPPEVARRLEKAAGATDLSQSTYMVQALKGSVPRRTASSSLPNLWPAFSVSHEVHFGMLPMLYQTDDGLLDPLGNAITKRRRKSPEYSKKPGGMCWRTLGNPYLDYT